MSKESVYLHIPKTGRMIGIWYDVFSRLRMSFDGLVSRNEVLSESSHCVEVHLDVVIGVLAIQSSFSFEFRLDEKLIEFW